MPGARRHPTTQPAHSPAKRWPTRLSQHLLLRLQSTLQRKYAVFCGCELVQSFALFQVSVLQLVVARLELHHIHLIQARMSGVDWPCAD